MSGVFLKSYQLLYQCRWPCRDVRSQRRWWGVYGKGRKLLAPQGYYRQTRFHFGPCGTKCVERRAATPRRALSARQASAALWLLLCRRGVCISGGLRHLHEESRWRLHPAPGILHRVLLFLFVRRLPMTVGAGCVSFPWVCCTRKARLSSYQIQLSDCPSTVPCWCAANELDGAIAYRIGETFELNVFWGHTPRPKSKYGEQKLAM